MRKIVNIVHAGVREGVITLCPVNRTLCNYQCPIYWAQRGIRRERGIEVRYCKFSIKTPPQLFVSRLIPRRLSITKFRGETHAVDITYDFMGLTMNSECSILLTISLGI